jgi:serine phosphatase RsbU (regulator of sigma subunit)
VEAKNQEGKMFTIERLRNVVEATNQQSHAYELLSRIYDKLNQYTGNTFRSDDITVMVLKILEFG